MEKINKTFQLFILRLIIILALINTLYAESLFRDTLRVASEPGYPPFCIVNSAGDADGFSIDLIKSVTNVMGLPIKINVAPWNQIKGQLAEGQLDILPLVGRSPERELFYDFTIHHMTKRAFTMFFKKFMI